MKLHPSRQIACVVAGLIVTHHVATMHLTLNALIGGGVLSATKQMPQLISPVVSVGACRPGMASTRAKRSGVP